MQYLRTVDWTKIHEVRGPVYDGHKLYDVSARLDGPVAKNRRAGGQLSRFKDRSSRVDGWSGIEGRTIFACILQATLGEPPCCSKRYAVREPARVALVKMK